MIAMQVKQRSMSLYAVFISFISGTKLQPRTSLVGDYCHTRKNKLILTSSFMSGWTLYSSIPAIHTTIFLLELQNQFTIFAFVKRLTSTGTIISTHL